MPGNSLVNWHVTDFYCSDEGVPMKTQKYDVFLSYRRDGGSETARMIRDSLIKDGYSVFFDMESLRSGPFNEKLYSIIEECTDFVLILPKNVLDRCSEETTGCVLKSNMPKNTIKTLFRSC